MICFRLLPVARVSLLAPAMLRIVSWSPEFMQGDCLTNRQRRVWKGECMPRPSHSSNSDPGVLLIREVPLAHKVFVDQIH